MEFKGKRVTVIGFGISGQAASLLLKEKGATVYATDSGSSDEIKGAAEDLKKKGISVETGAHTESFIRGSELVVTSPGVPADSEAILMAVKNRIPVVGEIEVASWFCKAPIIAVTGTNGKSTVVTLIGSILNAAGKNPIVCGNIGEAFCGKVFDISAEQIVVLEVSSFQLKRTDTFRPKVALITNITQNHFDWHPDFRDYFDSKKKIYANQQGSDFTILNYDDINLRPLKSKLPSQVYFFSMANEVEGAYCDGSSIILNINEKKSLICGVGDLGLKGEHNTYNALSACLCAGIFGAKPKDMKEPLLQFKGLEHRFQYIDDIEGVRFIDDSKATTVDACRAALSSCTGEVVLIAGGRDKGSDFNDIKDMIKNKVKALVLIGEAREKIKKALAGVVKTYDAGDMDDAVSIACNNVKRGDIVLLSPMCASFDMYKDYKNRGEAFCNAVSNMKLKTQVKT